VRHRTRLLILLPILVAIGAVGAYAWFSATGSGNASGRVGTLNAPTNVSASATAGTVSVSWAASTTSGGAVAPSGYYITRNNTSTNATSAACNSDSTHLIIGTSCSDSGVPDGSYTYTATAVYHTWTATSAASNTVTVNGDTTPPTSAISFPVAAGVYNNSGWSAGCNVFPFSVTNSVCGTASDNVAVQKVQVAVQHDGSYWDWALNTWTTTATPIWGDASGTTNWTKSFAATNFGLTGDGSYSVYSQAIDTSNNTQTTPTSKSFTIDNTAPTVSSINRAGTNPTNSGPLTWTVTFSEPVSGVATANFGLVTSGIGGTAPSITSATASGGAPSATWTVSVSTSGTTGTNSGSIQLNLTSTGGIKDAANNTLGATTPVAGQPYSYDTTAPTVSSISPTDSNPTNASTLHFTVSFSEAVKNVGNGNFTLTTSGIGGTTPTISSVSPSSGLNTTYTVTVSTSGTTGTNSGSIRLDLSSVGTIQDAATNLLAATFASGSAYTYDTTRPTVSSITRTDASPSNTGPLHWTVTFSEPVKNVSASNFALPTLNSGGAAPSISSVSPSSTTLSQTFTVTVSTSGTTGQNNGSIGLNLSSTGTIQDAATNTLNASTPVVGDTYGYDTTAPTVSSIVPADANPTKASTLHFTVSFSEPVKNVGSGNFTLTTSGIGGTTPTISSVSPSSGLNTIYTVTVSTSGTTGTNSGSIRLDLSSIATIQDAATNLLAVTFNTGSAYSYDTTAPTVSSVSSTTANGAYTTGSTIHVTVSFSEAVTVTGTPQLTLNTTPTRTANYVSGSGTSTLTFDYTVQAGDTSSDLDYASTSALALNGGTMKDAAANIAALTLPSPGAAGSLSANTSIVIDTTNPVVSGAAIANTITNTGGFLKSGGSYFIYANATDTGGSGVNTVSADVHNVSGNGATNCKNLSGGNVNCNSVPLSSSGGPFTVNNPGGGTTTYPYRSFQQTAQSLADGSQTFSVTAQDNATNSGSASASVTIDTTAPASPTAVTFTNGGGTGNTYINLANRSALTFSVTDASNTTNDIITVTLTSSGGGTSALGTATRGANSPTTVTVDAFAGPNDGTVTATAKATDPAGNDSTGTATLGSIPKDTVAPVAPSGFTYTDNSGSTADVLGGSAEANSMVTINESGTTTGTFTGTATAGGTFSITVGAVNGNTSGRPVGFSATAKDAAGNTGPAGTFNTSDAK
jgi:hypothetical protein